MRCIGFVTSALLAFGCTKRAVVRDPFVPPNYFEAVGKTNSGPYLLHVKGPAELNFQTGYQYLIFPLEVRGPKKDINVELKTSGKKSAELRMEIHRDKFTTVQTDLPRNWPGGKLEIEGRIVTHRTVILEFIAEEDIKSGQPKLVVTGPHQGHVTLQYLSKFKESGVNKGPGIEITFDPKKIFQRSLDKAANIAITPYTGGFSYSVVPVSQGRVVLDLGREGAIELGKPMKLRLQQDLERIPFTLTVDLTPGKDETFRKAYYGSMKSGPRPLF